MGESSATKPPRLPRKNPPCAFLITVFGFDNGNGVIYDGAAYATTEEAAVNRLERSLVEPILAEQEALNARLTAVTEAVRVLQVA